MPTSSILEPPPSTLEAPPSIAPPQQKQSRFKLIAFSAALALVLPELFCRFVIGLGDPPLYQADEKVEYLLQPSKTYYRFHNRFAVNRYGMRADDFPPQKSNPSELRVLVVGDSVVYGGVRIDQSEIDTEILKRDLQKHFGRPLVVGNASAKGWGPPNEIEYLKRYGTLNADVVILELSSHDYADAPTFIPVVGTSSDFPDKKPLLALADLFKTYLLPRYLHLGTTPAGVDETVVDTVRSERDIAECREAERDFFRFSRAHQAKVSLIQHLSLPELSGKYEPGYFANQAVAKAENVPYTDDADELLAQLKAKNNPFYEGDPIHLNRSGQTILAHTLQRALDLALKSN
jgi:hypothetical protein